MRTVIYILIVIIIGIALGAVVYFMRTLSTPARTNSTGQKFTIEAGQSTRDIADTLQKQNLIRSKLVFGLYVKLTRTKLQAGRYELNSNMTIIQISSKMSKGEVEQVKVVFPEGWRAKQMGDRLEAKELLQSREFAAIAEKEEGYLFPDTYTFPINATVETIITEMKENFATRTKDLKPTKDQIILASIIEREAKRDADRKLVASVYTNRMNTGMKLDADPTIQYAKGSWAAITVDDYQNTDSLYNTYTHVGLPPGPICNPGIKSIEAAMKPAKSNYFYFFHTRDGEAVFSKTLREHRQKITKYF